MGWFLGNGFGIQQWNAKAGDGPWVGTNVRDWVKPDIYVDLASSLERAGFDYILIEDTSMVEDTYGGSMEATLRRGFMAPKNDPMPLVPLMTQRSKHIGIIPTVSTVQYPPFLAARLMTTLDHLTEGRVGMNVVTSVSDRVAQNFGHDLHFEHDERYRMAEEWVDVVTQLWESWDDDAVVMDLERGVYADFEKVHPIHFKGKYFSSRGPMNTIPGPQRNVPIAQAGNSEPGRELAAKTADTMLAYGTNPADMKAFREDMSKRLIKHGRRPEDLKILFLAMPIVAASDSEAQARKEASVAHMKSDAAVEYNLFNMSYVSGGRIDFKSFPMDVPVDQLDMSGGNGEHSSMAALFKNSEGKTLRTIAESKFQIGDLGLIGSPDTVAAKMDEIMQEVGGDGFLFYAPTTRQAIAEIADGLGPALKKRGVIRDGFSGSNLKENLLEF